ncbi:MAG: chemotaxis-specific protein-glutamate methyltransferase CheB [Myxococcales bacterium]|nr:chemotaxis-specific protein-glutamate methyltransferase CheB [Myxococcales bacterium]
MTTSPVRVVVIDDSAYARQTITELLESDPGIKVIGRAADGEEGLKEVLAKKPDIVLLDLEMPRMDGFAFLRILMRQMPTPVLVITGLSGKENVFRALEAGALDFVAKPAQRATPALRGIQAELLKKVRQVTHLRGASLAARARLVVQTLPSLAPDPREPPPVAATASARLVAIGASTGGPPALQQLLAAIDPGLGIAVAITQHMPGPFTAPFADRLQRTTRWRVREARDGDILEPGLALVAPGTGSLLVTRAGVALHAAIAGPRKGDRFTPSVDRMFEAAAAAAAGRGLLAVVLTGMRGDGVRGVRAVHAAGGRLIAESEETAVIFGMPGEAIGTGLVDEVLPLHAIPEAIAHFAGR